MCWHCCSNNLRSWRLRYGQTNFPTRLSDDAKTVERQDKVGHMRKTGAFRFWFPSEFIDFSCRTVTQCDQLLAS